MAAGLPIVASDLPHETELMSASNCGILARPEDPVSFAQAILKLAQDRNHAFTLGQNGQSAFRKNYSWEGELPKLLHFYNLILAN